MWSSDPRNLHETLRRELRALDEFGGVLDVYVVGARAHGVAVSGPSPGLRASDHLMGFREGMARAHMSPWREKPARYGAMLREAASLPGEARAWPALDLHLPATTTGAEIAETLAKRTHLGLRHSFGCGVLVLPTDPQQLVRGRKRQAVRTARSRAQRLGLEVSRPTWVNVPDVIHSVLATRTDAQQHRGFLDRRVASKQGEFWAVESDLGVPIGLMVVTVAGEVAQLSWMLSADAPDRHAARYFLSSTVFMELSRRGARYVLSGSTIAMTPGLLYFQRRLGFAPYRVRVGP